MNIDFSVRKSAALWANTVANEDPGTADHAARAILARRVVEDISPREGGLDIVSNVILLVHTFASGPEPEFEEVQTLVETVMGVFVKLGAFDSGAPA